MPILFNDVFDGNTDLFSAAFYNMFVDAFNERLPTGYAGFPLAHVTAGVTDAQALARITNLQSAFRNGLCSALSTDPFGYVRINAAVDGTTYTTITEANVQASLSMQAWTFNDYKTIYLGGSGGGWTRKYTREFATAAATIYLDGSSFFDGQVARRGDNGLVYTRTLGAWVLSPTAFPDVVTAFGDAQAGDLIGPWLYTELRDGLKRMVWLVIRRTIGSVNLDRFTEIADEDNTGPTWGDSQALADAGWSAAAPIVDTTTFPQFDAHGYTMGQGTHALMSTSVAQVGASVPAGLANAVGRNPHAQIDYYSFLDAPSHYLSGRLGSAGEFDANGMTWGYRIWRKFSSKAQTGAITSSDAVGTNTKPAWCPAPGIPVGDPEQGWEVGWLLVIARMDVAGGFTYY